MQILGPVPTHKGKGNLLTLFSAYPSVFSIDYVGLAIADNTLKTISLWFKNVIFNSLLYKLNYSFTYIGDKI